MGGVGWGGGVDSLHVPTDSGNRRPAIQDCSLEDDVKCTSLASTSSPLLLSVLCVFLLFLFFYQGCLEGFSQGVRTRARACLCQARPMRTFACVAFPLEMVCPRAALRSREGVLASFCFARRPQLRPGTVTVLGMACLPLSRADFSFL